jgi:hypothetical protein
MPMTQMPMWRLGADLARATEKEVRVAIHRAMEAKRRHYQMGWNASVTTAWPTLDIAEDVYLHRHGTAWHADWLEGYSDHAAGREFGHLQQCPTHDTGECASKEFRWDAGIV